MAKASESKAVALVATVEQKQQAVAAFYAGGTISRTRELLGTLWGKGNVPTDVELRAWIADPAIEPERDVVTRAERIAQAQYKGKLVEARDVVLDVVKAKVQDPKTTMFNANGALIAIGNQIQPLIEKKPSVVNLHGAQFITKYNKKETEAIEGQFKEINGAD